MGWRVHIEDFLSDLLRCQTAQRIFIILISEIQWLSVRSRVASNRPESEDSLRNALFSRSEAPFQFVLCIVLMSESTTATTFLWLEPAACCLCCQWLCVCVEQKLGAFLAVELSLFIYWYKTQTLATTLASSSESAMSRLLRSCLLPLVACQVQQFQPHLPRSHVHIIYILTSCC